MIVIDALAELIAMAGVLLVAFMSLMIPLVMYVERRKGSTSAVPRSEPEPPQLDPDVAWAFREDADPAEVARLQAGLRRPLADLVAEAERKAIAAFSPLDGDPHQATVRDCWVSDRRQFPIPREAIEVTAMGDREPRYVMGPGVSVSGGNVTNVSGQCVPVMAGGGGSGGTTSFNHVVPEPAVLARLRERRWKVWTAAKLLADTAAGTGRIFSAEEVELWDKFNEEIQVLDARIKAVLKVTTIR